MSTPVNNAIVAYSTPCAEGKDHEYVFEATEVPYPTIDMESDAIIIKVEAAPINPSDLGRMMAGGVWVAALAKQETKQAGPGKLVTPLPDAVFQARRPLQATEPVRMGNEGCGTVVAAGSKAEALLGKRVCFINRQSYSKFVQASAAAVVPLPDGMSAELGASAFVNPQTVVGFVQTMRAEGHKALVHTAAASALGQMLVKYCLSEKIALVNIVRREEQVTLLKSIGATHVVNSSLPTFKRDLVDALKATGATLAFDACGGGDLASTILESMEKALTEDEPPSTYGSTTHKQVYLYGMLQWGPTPLTRGYGMAWGVGGWLMPNWYGSGKGDRKAAIMAFLTGINDVFKTDYARRITLEEAATLEVATEYAKQATGQKFLIVPN